MLVGPESRPDVSVVMVLWNCAPHLRRCVAALDREALTVELLCVDNASTDGSADLARALGAEVERAPVNLGFPAAVNRLIPRCQAPITLLLNPDVEIEPGCLDRCVRELAAPGVGMVGANLRRPDGSPDPPAARRFRTVTTIALESLGLPLLWSRLDLQYLPTWDRTTDRDVPCINGAFMLLPTETLRAVGGLDESVFLYLEDQELCRGIARRGETIRFVAGALGTHVGGGSTEMSSDEQRAAAYLHRLDASLEIVRRRQGGAARLVALVLLTGRSLSQLTLALLRRDRGRRLKHSRSLSWLVRQIAARHPPAPVP